MLNHKMIYGLWFKPERVVAGTALHGDVDSCIFVGRRIRYLVLHRKRP